MKFSEKLGWSLYRFLKGSGEVMIAIGFIVIIIGVCLPGDPTPTERSARVLILCVLFACLALGAFLIWAGVQLSDRDKAPLIWIRLRLTYKLRIRAALKAAKEVRRAGIRWDNEETAVIICSHIRDNTVEPRTTGAQIAWTAYDRYTQR